MVSDLCVPHIMCHPNPHPPQSLHHSKKPLWLSLFSLANSPPIFARLRAIVCRAKGSGKESRDNSRLETLFGEERWGKADIGQASDNGGSAVEVGWAGNRSLHRQEHVREGVRVVAGGGVRDAGGGPDENFGSMHCKVHQRRK